MPDKTHALTFAVVAAFLLLGLGSAPKEEEGAEDQDPASADGVAEPSPAPAEPVPQGPPPDPNLFAIPDPASWTVTELPRAGVRVRIPPDARISESGRFASGPQAGPYIGVVLPGGRDVQIDALDADVEWSRSDSERRRGLGELSILHSQPGELATQPTGVQGCRVTVCHAVGEGSVCASTGSRAVAGQEGVTYPTLRDCGVLISIVRSIEPL